MNSSDSKAKQSKILFRGSFGKKTASRSSVWGPCPGYLGFESPWALKSQRPGLETNWVLIWRVQEEESQHRQGDPITLCQVVLLCKIDCYFWFQHNNLSQHRDLVCYFHSQSVSVINSKVLSEPGVYFKITRENGWYFSQWMALNSGGSELGSTFPMSSWGVRGDYWWVIIVIVACWVWLSQFCITKHLPRYLMNI